MSLGIITKKPREWNKCQVMVMIVEWNAVYQLSTFLLPRLQCEICEMVGNPDIREDNHAAMAIISSSSGRCNVGWIHRVNVVRRN